MKRFINPDTLGSLIYPHQEKTNQENSSGGYNTEFQAMLDVLDNDEECSEDSTQISEKKRRLGFEQVKALEKIFEVDNKLEPERKVKIAEELGLQPRQVGIWFQNRRARWKTKQMERDYGVLKADYEALKLNYGKLETEKEALAAELKELKVKLGVENMTESNHEYSAKEEADLVPLESEKNNVIEVTNMDYEADQNNGSLMGYKHGLSADSNCSSGVLLEQDNNQYQNAEPTWMRYCFQLLDSGQVPEKGYYCHPQQQYFVKMEEQQSLFGTDEGSNNFFSADQPPNLHYHCHH